MRAERRVKFQQEQDDANKPDTPRKVRGQKEL
jgi:hypothetical protein